MKKILFVYVLIITMSILITGCSLKNTTQPEIEYSEGSLPCISISLFDDDGEKYPIDSVNKEDYVSCNISISNTETQYELEDVEAEFKGRGNGSWFGPGGKNGYRIKFKDKQELFGREKK